MSIPINVDRNVYAAVEKSIKQGVVFGNISTGEVKNIQAAIEQDQVTTPDEQKLLDALTQKDSNTILSIKTSDFDPVYQIITFPETTDHGKPSKSIYGFIESAPVASAEIEFKKALDKGDHIVAAEWLGGSA